MRHVRVVPVALFALAVVASSAGAQRTTTRARAASSGSNEHVWEFGADGQLQFQLSVPAGQTKLTTLSLPVSNFRAGVFLTDAFELEPFFGLNFVSGGGDSFTTYSLGAGGLYHFSTVRTQSQLYVRPFVDLVGTRATVTTGGGAKVTTSNSDVGIGVGVGMKWPMKNNRFAWRGEANIATTGNVTSLNLLWGISYFNR